MKILRLTKMSSLLNMFQPLQLKCHSIQGTSRRDKLRLRFHLSEKMMRNFLRSYIVVFFLPVMLIYMTFIYMNLNNVRASNLSAMSAVTSQTRMTLDNELSLLMTISSQIGSSTDFISLANTPTDKLSAKSTLAIYRLSRNFRDLHSFSGLFSDIMLYLPNNQCCINAQHMVYIGSEAAFLESMGLSSDLLDEGEGHLGAQPVLVMNKHGNVYYCVRIPSAGEAMGTVVIPLRRDYLQSLFNMEMDSQVFGGIVNLDGQLIYSRMGEALQSDEYTLNEAECTAYLGSNVYTYAQLDMIDAFIVYGVVSSALNANFARTVLPLLTVFFVSVTIFAVLTFHYAVRNYNPIKQLCALSTDSQLGEGEYDDAYKQLRQTLLEAIDVKRRMESANNITRRIEYGCNLTMQLRSNQADATVEELFQMTSAEFYQYKWVLIRAMLTDRFCGLFSTTSSQDDVNLDWMPVFSDYLVELLGTSCKTVPLFNSDELMFLVRLKGESDLRDRLALLQSMFSIDYSYETTVVVSEQFNGLTPFSSIFRRMYSECCLMLENQVYMSGKNLLFYDELFTPSSIQRESMALMHALAEHIGRGELAQANELAARIQAQIARALPDEPRLAATGSSAREDISLRAHTIVEQEYSAPDLSVSGIAERLGRSTDHVSRAFRATYGISLLDFIHQTRIRHARILLSEVSDVSVKAVADMVGYVTVDSFIRVFKKIEGITPGAYRARLKEEDEPDKEAALTARQ